jgi:hypothetical protein
VRAALGGHPRSSVGCPFLNKIRVPCIADIGWTPCAFRYKIARAVQRAQRRARTIVVFQSLRSRPLMGKYASDIYREKARA